MSDKRTVSTDALETLGMILGPQERRDAIHLAVEPVIAAQKLRPGQDVGIISKDEQTGSYVVGVPKNPKDLLGIVDPFLKNEVKKGERFWLVIYPRQITSLRHVWEHPKMPDELSKVKDLTEKQASEKWLRDWAAKIGITYNRLIDGADVYNEDDNHYINMGQNEEYSRYYSESDELWHHWEIVTGKKANHSGLFFSCSC
jgi:hypothetical protein